MDKDTNNTFGKWLKEQMDELCIVQNEMAEATGIHVETIRRYKNGDNPTPSKRAAIEAYIEEKRKYGSYLPFIHIDSQRFKEILLSLLEEFRGEIVLEDIAKAVGMSGESSISKRLNYTDNLKFNTEQQYKILNYFLKHCTTHPDRGGNNRILYKHRKAYYKILGLINNKNYSYIEEEQSDLIKYLITLPICIQEIILTAPGAFFDTSRYIFPDTREFIKAKDIIGRYRKMLLNRRLRFIFELEKKVGSENTIGAYDTGYIKITHLKILSDHVKMIESAEKRGISGPEIMAVSDDWIDKNYDLRYSEIDYRDNFDYKAWRKAIPADKPYDKQKQESRFEIASEQYTRVDLHDPYYIGDIDSVVEDIEYRLDMSKPEWYIWMLCIQHINKNHEINSIYDLLDEINRGMHRETDIPLDEFHCQRIGESGDFTYLDPYEDESIREYLYNLHDYGQFNEE